ncbi:MAG: hypothetical protein M1820_005859 [Bogoriella megaspora]|nr:MAG: hypothetical protein M1820_005859 [Bogoriella megaspora]
MDNLASIFRVQGRLIEAQAVSERVTQSLQRVLGKEHPTTLSSMNNLAMTLMQREEFAEAEKIMKQVTEYHWAIFGNDHPHTLSSVANLASIIRQQGRLVEAQELLISIVERSQWSFGSRHPHTLSYMNNLAMTYMDQGRLAEAHDLFQRVAEDRKLTFGLDHPDTLSSMNNLARHKERGRLREARDLFQDVLERRKTILGLQHSDTLNSMESLALTQKMQGQHAETMQSIQPFQQAGKNTSGTDKEIRSAGMEGDGCRVDHHAICVAAAVNGTTGSLEYVDVREDTGTSVNWISPSTLEKLMSLSSKALTKLKFVSLMGIKYSPEYRVKVLLNGTSNKFFYADCFVPPRESPVDGIVLGSDFIKEHGHIHTHFHLKNTREPLSTGIKEHKIESNYLDLLSKQDLRDLLKHAKCLHSSSEKASMAPLESTYEGPISLPTPGQSAQTEHEQSVCGSVDETEHLASSDEDVELAMAEKLDITIVHPETATAMLTGSYWRRGSSHISVTLIEDFKLSTHTMKFNATEEQTIRLNCMEQIEERRPRGKTTCFRIIPGDKIKHDIVIGTGWNEDDSGEVNDGDDTGDYKDDRQDETRRDRIGRNRAPILCAADDARISQLFLERSVRW